MMCMWGGSQMFEGAGSGMENFRANYRARFGREYNMAKGGSFGMAAIPVMAALYDKRKAKTPAAAPAPQITPDQPAVQTGAELYGTIPAKTGRIV